MTVVVGGDLRVVPVGDLVGEDLDEGETRESQVLDLLADYPLFGMVTWEVRPVLDFGEGADTIRAKLAEAQAAMSGG